MITGSEAWQRSRYAAAVQTLHYRNMFGDNGPGGVEQACDPRVAELKGWKTLMDEQTNTPLIIPPPLISAIHLLSLTCSVANNPWLWLYCMNLQG